MARVGFDPSTANHSSPLYTLGQVYEFGAKKYKYCRNKNTSAATTAGECAMLSNANGYEAVTPGNGTALTGSPFIGVWVGAVTKDYYGWVQVGGTCTNAKCNSTTAIGDVMVPDTTNQRLTPQTVSATPTATEIKNGDRNGGRCIATTAHSGGTCTVELYGV